jgi:hypothetical protein
VRRGPTPLRGDEVSFGLGPSIELVDRALVRGGRSFDVIPLAAGSGATVAIK